MPSGFFLLVYDSTRPQSQMSYLYGHTVFQQGKAMFLIKRYVLPFIKNVVFRT